MHNYPARLLRRVGFKCPSAFAQGQLPKDKKGSHYWLYLFTCNLQQMHITLSAGRSINWQRAVTIYQQGCRVERLPRLQPVMMSSNTSNRPLKSRRSALCMCDGELGAEGGGGGGGRPKHGFERSNRRRCAFFLSAHSKRILCISMMSERLWAERSHIFVCVWWPAFILRLLPPSVAVLLKKNIMQVKKGSKSVVKTFTTFTENNAGNDIRVGSLFLSSFFYGSFKMQWWKKVFWTQCACVHLWFIALRDTL